MMKKQLIFLLIIILLFFTSCKTRKQTDESGVNNSYVSENVYLMDINVGGRNMQDIEDLVDRLSEERNTEPRNAKYDERTWKIIEHKEGRRVVKEDTIQNVLNAQSGQRVPLVEEVLLPEVTYNDIQRNITDIATCTTMILNKLQGRILSMRVAAEKIDGIIVQSGDEFSFNKTLGYKDDTSHTNKASPEDSLSQLATTIYGAAFDGRLEITERHSHEVNVEYVSRQRDAKVVFGALDLKFVNNREYPIMIRVSVTSETVTAIIYENRNTALQ